jgi:hypothetical protein
MESMRVRLEDTPRPPRSNRTDFTSARFFYVTLHGLRGRLARLCLAIEREPEARYRLDVLTWADNWGAAGRDTKGRYLAGVPRIRGR